MIRSKPKSRDEPTATVDAEGNNLSMGDGQKATNEGDRGLRTHNVVVDWLSHWFHVAGIKHKGGFRGRPDTCKGLLIQDHPGTQWYSMGAL